MKSLITALINSTTSAGLAACRDVESRVLFTESEARNRVGAEVLTVTDLPGVPVGTRGRVIHANKNGVRGWTVTIEWDLPARRTAMLAQLGEFSFNIPWRTRTPAAEFSKSEVEQLLQPVAME